MASFVSTTTTVIVGGVDLTDHIESCEVSDDFEEQDFTNFGSAGNKERKAGLGDGSVTILWQQDYAASKVEATLYANRGALVTVVAKATSAATSATNPTFSASYLMSQWKPIAGKVGDKAGFTTTWKRSGALTRAAA